MKTILFIVLALTLTACAGNTDGSVGGINNTIYASYHGKAIAFEFLTGDLSKVDTTDYFIRDANVIHGDERGNIVFRCRTDAKVQTAGENQYLITLSYPKTQSSECMEFEKTFKFTLYKNSRADMTDY